MNTKKQTINKLDEVNLADLPSDIVSTMLYRRLCRTMNEMVKNVVIQLVIRNV